MQRPINQVRARFVLLLTICIFQLLSPGLGQSSRSSTDNPYDLRFAKIRAEFGTSEPVRQAVLVSDAFRLREFVDDASDVRTWLGSIAASSSVNQLVRDEAAMHVAFIQAAEGRRASAESQLTAIGFVRNWLIAGPFSDGDEPSEMSGERNRGVQSFAEGRHSSREWRQVSSLGAFPELRLSNFFPPSAVAYAASSVFSSKEQDVALRFSSEAPFSLILNGTGVFTSDAEGTFAFDQHAVAVHLNAGWNSIVVKFNLTNETSGRFVLRVTGLKGGGFPLPSRATYTSNPAVSVKTVATPDDLVDMARARSASEPESGELLAAFGDIEREHGRGTDLEHLQAAARMHPTAERWLDVSRSCHDPACRFNALSAAASADGKNVGALVGLADYYLSRNQHDRARDLLRQAIELSPRDFLAHDRLAELYVAAGFPALAAKESKQLIRDHPGPLWLAGSVGSRLADLGFLKEATLLLQRATSGGSKPGAERELLARIYRRQHNVAALMRILRQTADLDPNDVSVISELAELQLGEGDVSAAAKGMERALEAKPADATLRERYADILSRTGQDRAAERQLTVALQIDPRLERIRERLRLLSNDGGTSEEISYLEDPARASMAARCPTVQAGTNVTGVSDVRVERLYENGLSSVRSQQLFCMASEQGARDFATRLIQYSPASQELKLHHARVWKSDGRTLAADYAGETGVADTSVSMYYDVRSRALHFPDLQKGDVVELDYSVLPTASSNPYGNYFATLVPFRSMMPQTQQRYILIAPAKRALNIVEHSMSRAGTQQTRGDEHIYRWEEHDSPALPNEPRGPSLTESAPYVHVSTFGSWQEIGRWYAQMIKPQFEVDSALRELSSRITAGKHTELEKINAIHQFVLRNTHYVALEFGIYSYKPYPVTQIYARRFGDCKDKASLIIALLRQAGIEADIALVRTRRLGDIDERAVSIAMFNHAIVYVPKWNMWLDGTAEYAGPRELPLDDQGAIALTVGLNGEAMLRRIPLTRPEDNYTHREVRARVQPDGTIEFSGTAYTRGEDAPGLRRDFEVTERQRDLFRNSLAEVFPTVRLDDVHVEGATDLERDVNVQFRGALDTFAGQHVLTLSTSWMPRSYVQTLAQLEFRSQALVLPAPWTTNERLHFQFPGGANIISVPSDKSFDTPYGSAQIRYQRHGRELVISTSVQFRKMRVTPFEYGAFRQFCRDVDSAFRGEVKVTLPAS